MSNDIVQHHDWLPTFLAMAGEPDIMEKLKKGHKAGDKTFKVHIDGYNLLPYPDREAGTKSPRHGLYLLRRRRPPRRASLSTIGRSCSWNSAPKGRCASGPSRSCRCAYRSSINLRTDPYERADITSNTYYDWFIDHDFIALAATRIVTPFLETFKEFPPRQKAASFTIDQAMQKMNDAISGAGR